MVAMKRMTRNMLGGMGSGEAWGEVAGGGGME